MGVMEIQGLTRREEKDMRAWVILSQHCGGAKLNLGPRQGASPALKGLAVCPWWWHRLQMDGLGKGGGMEGGNLKAMRRLKDKEDSK